MCLEWQAPRRVRSLWLEVVWRELGGREPFQNEGAHH